MAADDKRKSAHPYIPNSVPSIQARMLETIGASGIEELYETIPEALRFKGRMDLPEPLASEQELRRLQKPVELHPEIIRQPRINTRQPENGAPVFEELARRGFAFQDIKNRSEQGAVKKPARVRPKKWRRIAAKSTSWVRQQIKSQP